MHRELINEEEQIKSIENQQDILELVDKHFWELL